MQKKNKEKKKKREEKQKIIWALINKAPWNSANCFMVPWFFRGTKLTLVVSELFRGNTEIGSFVSATPLKFLCPKAIVPRVRGYETGIFLEWERHKN